VIRELRRHGVTLERAPNLLRMARASFYRESRSGPKEERLKAEIRELALSQGAFGVASGVTG
jgi:hypothetical protein